MRILVLQNDPISPAGTVEERLHAAGAELEVIKPLHGDPLPSAPDRFTGAVVLGGAMSANDDDKYPALAPMRQLLCDFHAADKPLLGICLGSQILSRCFGGQVRPHTLVEFGYTPLTFTDEGRRDPLLAGLPNPQWIMQYHEDTFEVPAAGVRLMAGEACANQAFRVGRATYGFQCHFEATADLVRSWSVVSRPYLDRKFGDRVPATLEQLYRDIPARAPAQAAFAETVTERWLDLAKG
jgi:GMP synthase-like glutamine amidotransferase